MYIQKGNGFPYSLPGVGLGPRGDPGAQALSPSVPPCHYFSPSLPLPFQPQSITASWPVTNYTAR